MAEEGLQIIEMGGKGAEKGREMSATGRPLGLTLRRAALTWALLVASVVASGCGMGNGGPSHSYVAKPLCFGESFVHGVTHGINARGEVALTCAVSSYQPHAYLYADGTTTDLGTLSGGDYSHASAINDQGDVTGVSSMASAEVPGAFVYRAILYADGVMSNLGFDGIGHAINNRRHIAGNEYHPGSPGPSAFLYAQGAITFLGTLGGTYSDAYGMNSHDQVTGSATTEGDELQVAYIYSNGAMTALGTLGGSASVGFAINDAQQVTGMSFLEGDELSHAFLYSRGEMIDLGTFGGPESGGQAINNQGQVVGWSTYSSDEGPRAFLYTDGKLYDLNGLVASGLPEGTVIHSASGINDRGQIAADGCNAEHTCFGILLTPIAVPEQ